MQVNQSNTFFREDTLLGVCEALGQDFGFNAQYLRIALAVALFWHPVGVVGAYFGAGVLVLLSRIAVPNKPYTWFRRKAGAPAAVATADAPELADAEREEERVAIAA